MMKSDRAIRLIGISKKYKLGQIGYRTLREDIFNLIKGPGKRREYFWALKDVSFDLPRGGALGIIGANGAGKSTILKILAGVTKPSSGIVEKNGKIGALIELLAGFHPELTGRENIYLYGSIIGLKNNYIRRRFDEIVEFSGLAQFLDTPVKRYSSGMFTRLGFSVTAHLDPDILLIDEVLSVGDFMFQNKCINKMLEYRNKGTSIIFVSHNLDSVKKICGRTILLKDGRVAYDGNTEEAINEYYADSSEKQKGPNLLEAMELIGTKVTDPAGRPCVIVDSGKNITIELILMTKTALKDVYFAMFIRHSNGMVVFDTSSDLLNGKRYDLAAGQKVSLKYGFAVNLLKGSYMAGINIFGSSENSSPGYLFYENNIFTFTVKDNVSHQGIANLHAKCSVEPLS